MNNSSNSLLFNSAVISTLCDEVINCVPRFVRAKADSDVKAMLDVLEDLIVVSSKLKNNLHSDLTPIKEDYDGRGKDSIPVA